jgi:hypothetical protein
MQPHVLNVEVEMLTRYSIEINNTNRAAEVWKFYHVQKNAANGYGSTCTSSKIPIY